MKTDTKKKIYELCHQEGGVRPHDMVAVLGVNKSSIHRHLRKLQDDGKIEKKGMAPRVFYVAVMEKPKVNSFVFPENVTAIIKEHFCYFLPNGKELLGVEAFCSFLERTSQDKNLLARAKEYVDILKEVYVFRKKDHLICAARKMQDTFDEVYLKQVYYSDFYSLPKYGKTKLGQYILHGKSGQSRQLIKRVSFMTNTDIATIIRKHKIDAVCFAPHSIPRRIPFLKEFKLNLNLALPEVQLVKSFFGQVPIAQKSLTKLSERIENARETILMKDKHIPYKRVLVIDDALGSGATLNEIGRKLVAKGSSVWGYAIVGSYKGFEVIKEI